MADKPMCSRCGQRPVMMPGGTLCVDCIGTADLGEFEREVSTSKRPITDRDEFLREVEAAADSDAVAGVLIRYMPPADEMEKQALREVLLRVLTGKLKAPSKMIDAWLGTAPGKDDEVRAAKEAAVLVRLVLENAELFSDADAEPYAAIRFEGHRETHHIRKRRFRLWMVKLYFDHVTARSNPPMESPPMVIALTASPVPAAQAVRDAVAQLEGLAVYQGDEREVHVRIAPFGKSAVYLDLANAAWEAVEITPSGWKVVADPPVHFIRPEGMLPLPTPAPGGSFGDIRDFVLVTDEDWPLVAGFIVGMFHPHGPYPVLNLHGEHGTAKSSATKWIRRLVDPYAPIHRARPRNEHDLVIAASRSWVLSFDNLSGVMDWFSDALARLSTGGGFGARQLYSDDEERRFDARRPIILNGIEDLATRADLLDRSLLVTMPKLEGYRTEAELEEEFTAAWPRLLGACLDAVAQALAACATVEVPATIRMADFARWAVAAEPALGLTEGAFLEAYTTNRKEANSLALEASIVAEAVLHFAEDQPADLHGVRSWSGTSTDLLTVLTNRTGEETKRRKEWPQSGRGLSGALRRLAPNLRRVGLEVEFDRQPGGKRTRTVVLRLQGDAPNRPDRPDGPGEHDSAGQDLAEGDGWGRSRDGPGTVEGPLEPLLGTVGDDRDGRLHTSVGMPTTPRPDASDDSDEAARAGQTDALGAEFDAVAAEAMDLIRARLSEGLDHGAIADELNRKGFRPPSGDAAWDQGRVTIVWLHDNGI